jgi:MarR family transcriptional regulator, organic hydroperoxide resistance regulator
MTALPAPSALHDGSDVRLGKTLRFMQLLWALSHALDARSKRMQREIGITGLQRLVVRIVGRMPGIGAGELAGVLHVHPSTLTGVLGRLEERRLVARMPDAEDGRRIRLGLTARGREIDQDHAGTVEAALRRALARCQPAVVEAAREVIATIIEELEREESR